MPDSQLHSRHRTVNFCLLTAGQTKLLSLSFAPDKPIPVCFLRDQVVSKIGYTRETRDHVHLLLQQKILYDRQNLEDILTAEELESDIVISQ